MPGFYIKTHGCKVNQCDSEGLASRLESWGMAPTDDPLAASLCIVSTCTVTAVSDSKALKAIRATRRVNPDAIIAVTGCLARRDRDKILSTACVDKVLDIEDRDAWLSFLTEKGMVNGVPGSAATETPHPTRRTRAFVKVQDGCDSFCSYCVLPPIRGKPQSVALEQVCEKIARLVEGGTKEVVLTGIHLGLYGKDVSSDVNLATLIKALLERTDIARLRLSSLEVNEVTDELLALFASTTRLQRHFHVPLQSGDDAVLRSMNRHYTADDFRDCIRRIRQVDADMGISTDVMVGFPTETEEAFETTLRLVEELAFSRLHVFKYSPRPGTAAAKLEGGIPPDVAKRRSDRMIELGTRLSARFAKRFVGKTLHVLIESKRDPQTGWLSGFASNYLRACVRDATTDMVNTVAEVAVDDVVGAKAIGKVHVGARHASS
jgi:threonylcarbamoyladenosine tRNA methylthiotransferase MtaB